MNRFFIPADWISGNEVTLEGETFHQVSHVLRLKPGDRITVIDNTGREHDVELERFSAGTVTGKIVKMVQTAVIPGIKITLYQALLKSDKFEFVLQKGTELGVTAFIPFISERCAVKSPGESKMARWRKIIREAAEQSRRPDLPTLQSPVPFREACDAAEMPSVMPWEEESGRGLSSVLRSPPFNVSPDIGVFIGPEGGFSQAEADYARSLDIITVSLGRRILRAETAGLAALSAILYERGEMG